MPTVSVNLDTSQYVQVNTAFNPMVLQAQNDTVRITLSAAQPVVDNKVFHILGGKDAPLHFPSIDTNVWALAITDKSSLIVSETEPAPVALHDGDGNPITSLKGAIDVHNADVHNVIVNQYIHQDDPAAQTTITANTAIGDYQIVVDSVIGFAVNDFIHVNTTTTETTHPRITAINGNTFTLDRRLDKAHFIGDVVDKAVIDMARVGQVGTMADPQIYYGGPPAGEVWHITRILFSMVHGTAGDLGLFGNITALVNGTVLRARVSSQYGTLTNWKTNADMKTDMFDVEFDSRSGGQGSFGTSGRGSFAVGTDAVVRLDGDQGDRFEVIVQDDITLLDFFAMKVQGHTEGA